MLEITSIGTLLDLSWTIPAAPFVGSIVIAALLVSFTRTINRLTKPISLFLIICATFSSILSALFLFNHVSGDSFKLNFDIANLTLNLAFYLNDFVDKSLIVISSIFLTAMILSYYLLGRKKGYVRYMASLSFLSSLIYFITLNNDSFQFILRQFHL